ncbi:MAG: exopolyphosphatase, partial [Deltaproteobacteria bacterium]|nr:exopolyphosphatase [Deltaproteobacteria bacterium]
MRCASIDIGTNTLRLLIADRDPGSGILPVLYKRAITRLGGGYTEDAGISPEAAERTVKVLEDFSRLIAENHVQEVFASATSVVRRAKNKESFLSSVSTRTGINPSVISGTEEARLALAGVLSVLTDNAEKRLVIDIGGGSTEFIATRGTEIAGAWSMEMGVVHLTERHIISDPPKEAELSGMEAEITEVLTVLMMDMVEDGI